MYCLTPMVIFFNFKNFTGIVDDDALCFALHTTIQLHFSCAAIPFQPYFKTSPIVCTFNYVCVCVCVCVSVCVYIHYTIQKVIVSNTDILRLS